VRREISMRRCAAGEDDANTAAKSALKLRRFRFQIAAESHQIRVP